MKSSASRGTIALLAVLTLAATSRGARALSLDAALREAAAANPTLAGRRQAAEAAHRRIAPAGAWPSPMAEVGLINVPVGGGFDSDPMTMKMVGIEQRVPVFGANGLSRRSADAAAKAEGASLERASYEIYAAAWEAYADAYYAGQLTELSRNHRGDMGQLVASARARYESGRGRLEDVLRAQAEQARALSDLAGYEGEERGARARLAAILGRDGAALTDTLAPPPVVSLPDDANALIAALGEQHPRLRELQDQSDRYALAAQAARRSEWPDLQLGFEYGFREPIAGMSQPNMWTARVGFMLPVFAGSNERAQGAEMEAMAGSMKHELRAATLELDQQVRGLHATALADARSVSLLADTVLVTQHRAVAASMSAYDAGVADLWRVFEAMHELYSEEVMLMRAHQDLARTQARLLATTARADLFGLTLPEVKGDER
jgi:cobalt-zinc-cadmium efflux system outer membrane protein